MLFIAPVIVFPAASTTFPALLAKSIAPPVTVVLSAKFRVAAPPNLISVAATVEPKLTVPVLKIFIRASLLVAPIAPVTAEVVLALLVNSNVPFAPTVLFTAPAIVFPAASTTFPALLAKSIAPPVIVVLPAKFKVAAPPNLISVAATVEFKLTVPVLKIFIKANLLVAPIAPVTVPPIVPLGNSNVPFTPPVLSIFPFQVRLG